MDIKIETGIPVPSKGQPIRRGKYDRLPTNQLKVGESFEVALGDEYTYGGLSSHLDVIEKRHGGRRKYTFRNVGPKGTRKRVRVWRLK